jgi:hypothetical protein
MLFWCVNGICKTQTRDPDTYLNGSAVLDGIWNIIETGIYLATTNQIPSTNSGYGVFKYKWPGAWPLSTAIVSQEMGMLLYPNPITGQQTFFVQSDHDIQSIQMFDAKGMKINIETTYLSENKIAIQPLVNMPLGLYYVLCEGKSSRKMERILVN